MRSTLGSFYAEVLAVWALGVALSACTSGSGPVPGGGNPPGSCGGSGYACCPQAPFCENGLACNGGVCTSSSTSSCANEGQPCCVQPPVCKTGLACETGFCRPAPTPSCIEPFPATVIENSVGVGSFAFGDLNGDGRLDLILAEGGGVAVRIANADGTYGERIVHTIGTPMKLALADFGGDGRPSVLATSGMYLFVIHTPMGSNSYRSSYGMSDIAQGFAVGDLNGDGKLDVAVTNRTKSTVTVLFRNPDNLGFDTTNKVVVSAATSVRVVAIGDINGDGKPDLVSAGGCCLGVTLGNGDGTFQTLKTFNASGFDAADIALADLNKDGKLDAVITLAESDNVALSHVSVLLGSGDGTFGAATPYDMRAGARDLIVRDLDGDGKLDLVAAASVSNAVSFFRGRGDGMFDPRLDYGVGSVPIGLAMADFEQDGDLDLFVSESGGLRVLRPLPGGRFDAPVDLDAGTNPVAVRIGDMDVDGIPDLVVADETGHRFLIFRGLGGGAFGTPVVHPVSTPPQDVALADLDVNGRPDIVTATGGDVSVLLANLDGTFAPALSILTESGIWAVGAGHLNGDAFPDVVVLNGLANTIGVLLGNGDGTFQPKVDYTADGTPKAVAFGDLNGDGAVDLAVTLSMGPGRLDLINNGDGTFLTGPGSWSSTYGTGDVAIAAADVTGDGITDLVVLDPDVGYDIGAAGVYPGFGDGTFHLPQGISVGTHPEALAVADLAGDPHLDLVVTISGSVPDLTPFLISLTNDGRGQYPTLRRYAVGTYPVGLATGDLNGDGHSDAVVATWGDHSVRVFLNRCAP